MQQPADLELVRASYDRVAATYVALGIGDLAPQPWLRAGLAAFAEAVRGLAWAVRGFIKRAATSAGATPATTR